MPPRALILSPLAVLASLSAAVAAPNPMTHIGDRPPPAAAPLTPTRETSAAPTAAQPSQVRRPSAPPAGRAAPTTLITHLAPDAVRARAEGWLTAHGFVPADPERRGDVWSYSRLVDTQGFGDEADCRGTGVGAFKLAITRVALRLAPEGDGTRVATTATFSELRIGPVSRKLLQATCRSRGAVEAAVLAAAVG